MTAPKVLLHTQYPDPAVEILAVDHPDITPATWTDYDGLADAVDRAKPEVVFTNRFAPGDFPRAALIDAPSVKWVSNAGSGVNHLMPWDPAVMTVSNSAGVAADAMAHYALSAMLHFAMDLPGLKADQAKRHWQMNRTVRPLTGATLLIIGLGKTGSHMASIAEPMGMHVLGIRARPQPTPHVAEVGAPADLPDMLARADYILVAMPLLDSTRGLLNAGMLAHVKPGAVLVDVSRGGIVDPTAMIAALDDGRLAGAALDVFETEPLPAKDPLWARDDVLVSPHCSGVYEGWEAKSVEMFAQNLTRWRTGQPLQNVVDPARGY